MVGNNLRAQLPPCPPGSAGSALFLLNRQVIVRYVQVNESFLRNFELGHVLKLFL